jgi:hypothetical protein
MERLLQGLRCLLRLTAVTLQALLRVAVATLSGFGLSFRVSLRERHGALLRCVWVLYGCSLPQRMRPRPSRHVWQRASTLRNALPALSAFLCWCFAVQMGQHPRSLPCILKPQMAVEGRQ